MGGLRPSKGECSVTQQTETSLTGNRRMSLNRCLWAGTTLNEGAVLPESFGDGWLSANARDLVRIVFWAGQDSSFLTRVALAAKPGRVANTATVERVLQEMYDEPRGRDVGVQGAE